MGCLPRVEAHSYRKPWIPQAKLKPVLCRLTHCDSSYHSETSAVTLPRLSMWVQG